MAIEIEDTAATTVAPAIDPARLQAFVDKAIDDMAALASAPLILMGERLGLYDALAEGGPLTAAELAARTGTVERYVREWLLNQAAGGYLSYDPTDGRYSLPAEHALVLPALYGVFETCLAANLAAPRVEEAFRRGGGVPWGEHDAALFTGIERLFAVRYQQYLVSAWIPALEGVESKLRDGALVADVGCGHGAATIILAQAYPRSRFVGFDNHAPSIERARLAAEQAGVADRVRFEVASAVSFPAPSGGYDLVAFFDAVHDLDDPLGAARRAADVLAPGGSVMLVEPQAGERVEDNFNPMGRVCSANSVLICTTNSLASGGPGLGTLATEAQFRGIFGEAGFGHFRRATETDFNRVFEARL